MSELKYENWIDRTTDLKYSEYWNDSEKDNIFNVVQNGFEEMEEFLNDSGLYKDIDRILKYLNNNGVKLQGNGIDIASGNLWATAYLIENHPLIKQLYCLEYSKPRLLHLGPALLKHYKIDTSKVGLILGSFYDIKLDDNSLDFAFVSEALHHADDLEKILSEIHRVLKPGGVVINIGEIYIGKYLYLKCYLNYLVSKILLYVTPKLFNKLKSHLTNKLARNNFREIYFPPDPELGDHYYTHYEFISMIGKRFEVKEFKSTNRNLLSFCMKKNLKT